MKTKVITTIMITLFLLVLMTVPVLGTVGGVRPWETYTPYCKDQGQAGKSDTYHLYLVTKNPVDWSIVVGGAWGKLTFDMGTGKFVFNGHGLSPGVGYSLIEYPKPQTTWPWPINILASGTADGSGNIHLSGTYSFATGQYIWLVLSADLVGNMFTGWNPTSYLFEYDVIM